MKKRMYFVSMLLTSALGVLTTSCVNSDYDLSDLDTNVRVAVNDLVVPVNLDAIKLDNVLDLDDDSRIKKMTVDGKEIYGVIESGSFNSGNIKVSPITISRPVLPTISNRLDVNVAPSMGVIPAIYDNLSFAELQPSLAALGVDLNTQLLHFQIEDVKETISFRAENVDKSIKSVDALGLNTRFNVTLEFPGVTDFASTYHINDLKVQLPKGFTTDNANYNKETGVLTYSTIAAGSDMKVSIDLNILGIDMKLAGAEFKNNVLSFSQEISAEGYIDFSLSDIKLTATPAMLRSLQKIDYRCNASFDSDLTVNKFSGDIRYEVTPPTVNPVSLENLPEMLQQSGTVLDLTNPQIYVNVDNPIDAKFNVHPVATLTLTPNPSNAYGPFIQKINIHGGSNKFCLAPQKPESYMSVDGIDYSTAEYQVFSNLGHILACKENGENKVAEKINIDVTPVVDQKVENFELKEYGVMNGNYAFVTPVALTENSLICYDKLWDTWQSDGLDGLTVKYGVVTATVTSDIPLSVESETVATILGRDSHGNPVSLKGTTTLPANVQNYQLNIKLDQGGPVSRIYGMELKLRAKGAGDTLAPDQTIIVKDVKAKVSGFYEKEL